MRGGQTVDFSGHKCQTQIPHNTHCAIHLHKAKRRKPALFLRVPQRNTFFIFLQQILFFVRWASVPLRLCPPQPFSEVLASEGGGLMGAGAQQLVSSCSQCSGSCCWLRRKKQSGTPKTLFFPLLWDTTVDDENSAPVGSYLGGLRPPQTPPR